MSKFSISSSHDNHLSYLDNYEELNKFNETNNKTINDDDQKLEQNEIKLSSKLRWFIFIIILFINVFINMDHGTVPAATDKIKKDLNINNNILGLFGSLVFLGNLIGKITIYFWLINILFNDKFF